jgi:hypothetical protein
VRRFIGKVGTFIEATRAPVEARAARLRDGSEAAVADGAETRWEPEKRAGHRGFERLAGLRVHFERTPDVNRRRRQAPSARKTC